MKSIYNIKEYAFREYNEVKDESRWEVEYELILDDYKCDYTIIFVNIKGKEYNEALILKAIDNHYDDMRMYMEACKNSDVDPESFQLIPRFEHYERSDPKPSDSNI